MKNYSIYTLFYTLWLFFPFHQDLESKYSAVLQMYGEKAEEAEELKMDLHDIKNMYKQQVSRIVEKYRVTQKKVYAFG